MALQIIHVRLEAEAVAIDCIGFARMRNRGPAEREAGIYVPNEGRGVLPGPTEP